MNSFLNQRQFPEKDIIKLKQDMLVYQVFLYQTLKF